MSTRALLLGSAVLLSGAAFAQAPPSRLGPTEELDRAAPAEAQALSRRALAAMSKGQLAAAKKDFEGVLVLAPNNLPTTINLGLLAYRQKDFPAAESFLKKATHTAPENGLPWLLLGIVYYEQEKLDAALAALAQAVLFAPKDARAHHFLGVTVGKKGWYSGAEDEMRKAIALDPDYGEAHFNLAVFYLERKPPALELARRHYEKSRDLGGPPDADVARRLEAEGK